MEDLSWYQYAIIGLTFVWSGFVRSGLGFGGTVLALPFLLLVVNDPLIFLPLIAMHLIFFSTLIMIQSTRNQAPERLKTINWAYLKRRMAIMIVPKIAGAIGLLTLPPVIMSTIIFVIVIGFGPLAGVLAMTFYTVGYLGKLQYETFEGMPSDSLEVSKAMGLSHPATFTSVVIPETGNHLLSQLMFMFEYNVRHGTVIGIVGAGGIGYYINTYLKFLQYDKVLALLILIFRVVVVIDLLSLMVRSFVTDEGDVRKPKWLSFLMKYMDWSEGKQSTE